MQTNKKLNLLPVRLKNKYLNRYFVYFTSVVCGIALLVLLFLYGNMAVLSYQIHALQKENAAYNSEKTKIEELQNKISVHKKLLSTYESGSFPFVRFVQVLELYRPFGVCLLSVDSTDRLINEGVLENGEEKAGQKQQTTEENPQEETEETVAVILPEIEYKKDLSGEKLVIRGYSSSQEAVSKFIYDISRLSYITESQIIAIEQHRMDGNAVNFFEFIVTGGTEK